MAVSKLTGAIAMAESGRFEAPIMLTGTTTVGRVFDAVVDAVFEPSRMQG